MLFYFGISYKRILEIIAKRFFGDVVFCWAKAAGDKHKINLILKFCKRVEYVLFVVATQSRF